MDKTLLILAHGSKAQSTTEVIYQVRGEIAKRNLYKEVKVAFMEFNHPNIREAFDEIYKEGLRQVVAVPMFLFRETRYGMIFRRNLLMLKMFIRIWKFHLQSR